MWRMGKLYVPVRRHDRREPRHNAGPTARFHGSLPLPATRLVAFEIGERDRKRRDRGRHEHLVGGEVGDGTVAGGAGITADAG
jgi:hypothetical protein